MSSAVTEPAWPQLSLRAGRLSPEELEQALLAAGALAVTLQDAAENPAAGAPVLEPAPNQTPLWPQTRVTGLFERHTDPAQLQQKLAELLGEAALAACRPEAGSLADRDWINVWAADFKPRRFGRRLWICPSHSPPPQPDAVNIILDPGLAFGTGSHPTTALCLRWLDEHPPVGLRVLDYGCGSGILALAAAKLGAVEVWGVDIDPQALLASRDNALSNGLAEKIRVCAPGQLPPGIRFDVIVANILATPLVELADTLQDRLDISGRLALSGILSEQAETVAAAYRLRFASPQRYEGWALLDGSTST